MLNLSRVCLGWGLHKIEKKMQQTPRTEGHSNLKHPQKKLTRMSSLKCRVNKFNEVASKKKGHVSEQLHFFASLVAATTIFSRF